ncbi:MAG: TetR/AcrR family transcriptional regulator [Pseudomonadota bacterium]
MTDTERRIIEAAIQTFVRYGAKKTTMADIADAADVSRQTVYASFKDKDGIIVACIRHITDQSLGAVRSKLVDAGSLEDELDIYFAETILKSFELLQSAGDPEDLISGHNRAGKAEIERSHERHKALIAEILSPHAAQIAKTGQSAEEVSNFLVTAAMGFKSSTSDRAELDALLKSLKLAVSSIAEAPSSERR